MVTAFHRLAVWPHMRVSDDNAGHEEALVAALYNNTFQVVCFILCTCMTPTAILFLDITITLTLTITTGVQVPSLSLTSNMESAG